MWRDDAACAGTDTEVFFPIEKAVKDVDRALTFCTSCPVRDLCLQEALSMPPGLDYGIWGGTTRTQRITMRGVERAGGPCKRDGCGRPQHTDGYCSVHHSRKLRGKINNPECATPGCINLAHAGLLCGRHQGNKSSGHLCPVDGCIRKRNSGVLCSAHQFEEMTGTEIEYRGSHTKGVCDVKGCSSKHLAGGLCRNHYSRFRYQRSGK